MERLRRLDGTADGYTFTASLFRNCSDDAASAYALAKVLRTEDRIQRGVPGLCTGPTCRSVCVSIGLRSRPQLNLRILHTVVRLEEFGQPFAQPGVRCPWDQSSVLIHVHLMSPFRLSRPLRNLPARYAPPARYDAAICTSAFRKPGNATSAPPPAFALLPCAKRSASCRSGTCTGHRSLAHVTRSQAADHDAACLSALHRTDSRLCNKPGFPVHAPDCLRGQSVLNPRIRPST